MTAHHTHCDFARSAALSFTLRLLHLFQQRDELLFIDALSNLSRLSHLDEQVRDTLSLLRFDEGDARYCARKEQRLAMYVRKHLPRPIRFCTLTPLSSIIIENRTQHLPPLFIHLSHLLLLLLVSSCSTTLSV